MPDVASSIPQSTAGTTSTEGTIQAGRNTVPLSGSDLPLHVLLCVVYVSRVSCDAFVVDLQVWRRGLRLKKLMKTRQG